MKFPKRDRELKLCQEGELVLFVSKTIPGMQSNQTEFSLFFIQNSCPHTCQAFSLHLSNYLSKKCSQFVIHRKELLLVLFYFENVFVFLHVLIQSIFRMFSGDPS